MSRKNHNSVLFLTTLGVYLGLVLVGATPQVLAQAATAKQFNVKDEIEVNDDLDRKPDDCERLAAKAREKQQQFVLEKSVFPSYAKAIASVIAAVREYELDPDYLHATAYGPSNLPKYIHVSFSGRPVLVSANARENSKNALLALAAVFPTTNFESKNRFEFEFTLKASELTTTSKYLRSDETDAHRTFVAYDSLLDLWRCTADSEAETLVSKNSELTWADNYFIITTRLPRGSLDTLLASNAQ